MGVITNNGVGGTASTVSRLGFEAASLDVTTTPDELADGAFRHRATGGFLAADFDLNYAGINAYHQGSQAGSYTVQGGESLASVAQSLYGDAALWYKIAQVNGLSSPDAPLTAGTSLQLPAGVTRTTYNAGTVQPYNPGEAIGDVSPTTPEPPKDGNGQNCGTIGQLLLVVVAVAVQFIPVVGQIATAVGSAIGSAVGAVAGATAGAAAATFGTAATAGAISSAASQGVGVATGIQDKFSWKSVGLAALSAGLGKGGLNVGGRVADELALSGGFARRVVSGAATSAATQGIATATGLQDSFSWSGVAAAGVGAGIFLNQNF